MTDRENVDPSEMEKRIFLGAGRLETRVLHDYLFTEVETHLSSSIIDYDESSEECVSPGSLVRVSGIAELDDTNRLLAVAENFNEFYGSVLLIQLANSIQDRILRIENELDEIPENTKNKLLVERRRTLERELRRLTPKEIVRSLKVGVPDLTIDMLKMWLNLLYKDVFEIKILPETTNGAGATFRAILDAQYLRESPTLTYAKYGSRTKVAWTLVGLVTTVLEPEVLGGTDEDTSRALRHHLQINDDEPVAEQPSIHAENHEDVDRSNLDDLSDAQQPTVDVQSNIRDAIEGVFTSIFEIERFLTVSASKRSYVLTPLAIYHEAPLK